jgi:hypothetical protein
MGLFVPPYRPVQDHMWNCHTSRITAKESCTLLTPASYICHHRNTPVAHPLASDVTGYGFLIPIDWINVVLINANYNKKNIINTPVRLFQTTIAMNYKISVLRQSEIPDGDRGGGHVSEVVPPSSASLARLFASSCTTFWCSQVPGVSRLTFSSTSHANLFYSSAFNRCSS